MGMAHFLFGMAHFWDGPLTLGWPAYFGMACFWDGPLTLGWPAFQMAKRAIPKYSRPSQSTAGHPEAKPAIPPKKRAIPKYSSPSLVAPLLHLYCCQWDGQKAGRTGGRRAG